MTVRYVLRDKDAIGFILSAGRRFRAYDQNGRGIGLFEDDTAAATAVYQHANAIRAANPAD